VAEICYHEYAKYLNRMKLRGQSESGYAMAVLLVAMSVMAVMMTVAMPVWNQAARREKEAELAFRGQQYARAIGLYQRKYANTPPPSIDVLVQEKFLRKKFKDPITGSDFVPIPAAAGGAAVPGPATGRGAANAGSLPGQATTAVTGLTPGGRGGIVGVTSSSTAQSIRIYNGATTYNQWRFIYAPTTATPGAGAPGTAAPGIGAPGTASPGQRGQPSGPGGFPGRGGFQGLDQRGRGPGGQGPGAPTRGGPGGAPTQPVTPGGRGR
jgi:type II secretory pathway pseudopilin PulG